MSLLSETVGTVLQTSEPIVYSALSTPVDPNVVTLASAVYEVPTSGLAVNTNVQVPLNIAIPPRLCHHKRVCGLPGKFCGSSWDRCGVGN